jgi:hypothetical protein
VIRSSAIIFTYIYALQVENAGSNITSGPISELRMYAEAQALTKSKRGAVAAAVNSSSAVEMAADETSDDEPGTKRKSSSRGRRKSKVFLIADQAVVWDAESDAEDVLPVTKPSNTAMLSQETEPEDVTGELLARGSMAIASSPIEIISISDDDSDEFGKEESDDDEGPHATAAEVSEDEFEVSLPIPSVHHTARRLSELPGVRTCFLCRSACIGAGYVDCEKCTKPFHPCCLADHMIVATEGEDGLNYLLMPKKPSKCPSCGTLLSWPAVVGRCRSRLAALPEPSAGPVRKKNRKAGVED